MYKIASGIGKFVIYFDYIFPQFSDRKGRQNWKENVQQTKDLSEKSYLIKIEVNWKAWVQRPKSQAIFCGL